MALRCHKDQVTNHEKVIHHLMFLFPFIPCRYVIDLSQISSYQSSIGNQPPYVFMFEDRISTFISIIQKPKFELANSESIFCQQWPRRMALHRLLLMFDWRKSFFLEWSKWFLVPKVGCSFFCLTKIYGHQRPHRWIPCDDEQPAHTIQKFNNCLFVRVTN